MSKTKFLQTAILAVFISFIMASCGTSMQTGVKQVQLSMSKAEVISKLGKDFQIVSMAQTEHGNLEVLRFVDSAGIINGSYTKGYYILHFLNGKLVELNYEDYIPPIHPPHPHNSNN